MTARPPQARFVSRIPQVIVGLLLLIVIGSILIGLAGGFPATLAYILFVFLTVFVVRSVPVEPGAWLGHRTVRRVLVAVIALLTVDLLFMNTIDIPTLVALVLCDYALGRATRRLAGARDDLLDERQSVWRNRAYRIGYVIFGVTVASALVVADLASPATRQWLADSLQHGGAFVSFIELLAFLPAMVIAWNEPDRISDGDAPRLRQGLAARTAAVMVILSLVIPVVLSVSLAVAPIRTVAFTQPEAPVERSAMCTYFEGRKEAGVGFGATVLLSAVACWNGTTAFEEWGLNASDCFPRRRELVNASTVECRRTTGADGTLHFTYRTLLRSSFLPFITRDVTVTLAMTKNGKVVEFP